MVGEVYYNSETEYHRPYYSEGDLARSVIMQAVEDAESPTPSHQRLEARKFLCGSRKSWEDSLYAWCEVANIDATFIIRKCREKYYVGGKLEW